MKERIPPFELRADEVQPTRSQPRSANERHPPITPFELPADAVNPLKIPAIEEGTETVKPAPRRRWLGNIFFAALVLFILAILIIEAVEYTLDLVNRAGALGGLLSIVLAVLLVSGILLAGREIRAFYRQKHALEDVEACRQIAERILYQQTHGEVAPLAARVLARYEQRPELLEARENFLDADRNASSDQQSVELLTKYVVQPLDRQAYRIVARGARDCGVGAMLSPVGLFDAVLVLWRTMRMLRDIASVYGFYPGFLGRMALLRKVLTGAAMAGAIDQLSDFTTAQIGGGLAGMLSAKFGEGMLVATRTARFGLIAMAACRPVPFNAEDVASFSALMKQVLAGLNSEEGHQSPVSSR